jgi:ATP-dependent helicase/nuclease subunit A
VLERLPLERWGAPIPLEELLAELSREGLDASSIGPPQAAAARLATEAHETALGIQRFLASEYARSLRRDAQRVEREIPLTVAVTARLGRTDRQESDGRLRRTDRQESDGRLRRTDRRQLELFEPREPAGDAAAPSLVVRATLDLVVERKDGSVEVLDYKRTRGADASRYFVQLALYRRVLESRYPDRPIRSGLVHLLGEAVEPSAEGGGRSSVEPSAEGGGRSPGEPSAEGGGRSPGEPEWVTPPALDLARLAEELVRARHGASFPGVPLPRCRAARCGFVAACHPASRTSAGRTSER